MSEHLSNAMSKERYHQNCIIRYIFDFVKNIYKKNCINVITYFSDLRLNMLRVLIDIRYLSKAG